MHSKHLNFSLLKFGLFCKIVPSLGIDVLDILFDTTYFSEIVSNNVLHEGIHVPTHVYVILFTFQITGSYNRFVPKMADTNLRFRYN